MDQLLALWALSTSSIRWSSLRPGPCFIRCIPGLCLRADFFSLIFINDLLDTITFEYSVCLFADDCVLYRNIHCVQDCLILQEDLDSLALWEADWQMKFYVAEVIPRGKYSGSARIRTQNSCMTVDHSNHVAKELTQQRGC